METTIDEIKGVSLQDQIWIWGGVLLGLWIILAAIVLGLCLRMRKIAKHLNTSQGNSRGRNPDRVFSFGNEQIMPGEELARRGFTSPNPTQGQSTDSLYFAGDFGAQPGPSSAPSTLPTSGRPKNMLANENMYRNRDNSSSNPNFMY